MNELVPNKIESIISQHHRTTVYNNPEPVQQQQDLGFNQKTEEITYHPRNAEFLENPNIAFDIAQKSSKYIESMYVPSPIVPLHSDQHLVQQINYYHPDSQRPFSGVPSQIPRPPLSLNRRPSGIKESNQTHFLNRFCNCCPFGKQLSSRKNTSGVSAQYCPKPNTSNYQSKQQVSNQGYCCIASSGGPGASEGSCRCSRGMNVSTLPPYGQYFSEFGYHGIGYDIVGGSCCDGPGGLFSPTRNSGMCCVFNKTMT